MRSKIVTSQEFVLVLNTKEAEYLRGYVQNDMNGNETESMKTIRNDIFNALILDKDQIHETQFEDYIPLE